MAGRPNIYRNAYVTEFLNFKSITFRKISKSRRKLTEQQNGGQGYPPKYLYTAYTLTPPYTLQTSF